MKNSIFLKIFSGFLLIIILLTSLVLIFSFTMIKSSHLDTLAGDLRNLALALRSETIQLLEEDRIQELNAFVKELGRTMETRITIVAPDGTVLADSERNPEMMDNHAARYELIQALAGRTGRSLRYSDTVKEEMLYVAIPLEKNAKSLGALRVSLFVNNINILLSSLKLKFVQTGLIAVIISVLVAGFFSRNLSRRIKMLSVASKRITDGDFDVRVFSRSQDELRDLADNFNSMASTMKSLFTKLSSQKGESHDIIASLREGLIVMDQRGEIILANGSFKNLVHDDKVEGKFYWKVIRDPGFSQLVKLLREKKENLLEEVELEGRIFLCSGSPLASEGKAVVILHDVTEIRALEEIKKDFFVNASHELRTPLTVIKGFAETLRDEYDLGNVPHFSTLLKHTDRLVNIVNDLLTLSELEEKKGIFESEPVNVKDIWENVIMLLKQRIREKNLNIRLHVDKDVPPVETDPFRLEQMFINLLDNAVKYTEEGEIVISVDSLDSRIRIEIEDTGVGIPEEHITRIFERFYVVDRSRSRELGGTGLGLSIVKHIVLNHRGTISVESKVGEGTKFVITLPTGSSCHTVN